MKDVPEGTLPEMNAQAQKQVTDALATLEYYKYDTKELWREYEVRVKARETGKPTPDQLRYVVPDVAPPMAGHLVGDGDGMPQALGAHVMWKGYHYGLTPGQRRWFRENEDMTPARTVTVVWVECWPGTNALKAFKIESDVHVDPQHRAHVLVSYVIRNATRFFDESARYDREEANANTLSLVVGKVNVWTVRHAWAVKDLTKVKLSGEVTIAFLDEGHIDFKDTHGNYAVVDRKEFLTTVADYVRLYEVDDLGRKSVRAKGGKPGKTKAAQTLTELMAEMAKEFVTEV